MTPREPAGEERGKGKSAELSGRARREGGSVGNTCGTVCGNLPQVRYLPRVTSVLSARLDDR